ncbi:MAG: hypothetical protein ABEJ31_03720 [Haloarculaceae archaeon]
MDLPRVGDVGGRVVVGIVASTLVLTAAFVGLLGVLSGDLSGTGARLPIYVLGLAAAFVASVVWLARLGADGATAMLGSVGIAVASFVLFGLAGEGVVYTVRFSGRVLGTQLLAYFVAAGLICTGLGYWVLTYWRDVVARDARAGI